MLFVETRVFSRSLEGLLSDEDYRLLQAELSANPAAGDLIPGGGGIRKYRFALPGRGKRGGARLIYYWQVAFDRIFMLLAYAKNRCDDLAPDELASLRQLVRRLDDETKATGHF